MTLADASASPTVAREVGRLLHAFAKAARAQHLYRAKHVLVERMIEELAVSFTELLARIEEFSLKVRPDAFLFDDERVFEEPNPDESVPYTLYRDGIRRIDFSRGLTEEELRVLVSATVYGMSYSGLGDDMVSFLWQHELEHVHYVVVDTTIVDASGKAAKSDAGESESIDIDAQIDGLLLGIYGQSRDDVGPRSVHVDATDVPAKMIADSLDSVDEMAPGFHPLRQLPKAPAYAKPLSDELAAEDETRTKLRALYCALDAFPQTLESKAQELLAQSLLDLFDAALVAGDLKEAGLIVSAVRSLSELPYAGEQIDQWVEEATAETRLRQIAPVQPGASGAVIESMEAIRDFFFACGPKSMPSLFGIIPNLQEPAQRRALSDIALEIGIHALSPLKNLLEHEQTFAALEALYMLLRLGTPGAQKLALGAETHPQASVRQTLLACWEQFPSETSFQLAMRMLNDPEPRVVAAAVSVLGRFDEDVRAIPAIENLAKSPALEDAPIELKQAVLIAYANLHKSSALPLIVKYIREGDGKLSRKGPEELAMAGVRALAQVSTPAAINALKKAATSWNKRVKQTAKETLDAIGISVSGRDA